MSPGLQAYYDAQFSMMASKGWSDLCDDLRNVAVPLQTIETLTPENLQNRQGRLAEIALILNRRAIFEQAYAELSDDTPTV